MNMTFSMRKRLLGLIPLLTSIFAFGASGVANADWVFENPDGTPPTTLIQSAHASIDIEIYTMADPQVQTALLQAMGRGVRVRVIQEPAPYDSPCHVFEAAATKDGSSCKSAKQFVLQVQSQGGQYVPFNKSLCGNNAAPNCFEHGKIMLVDGTSALISTGNFDASNLCDTSVGVKKCDRDYTFVTTDPGTISTLEQIFETDLLGIPYDLPSILAQPAANALTVSPFSLTPLVNFINTATTSLQIEEQYLWQTQINQAIMSAAQRGVHVEIMVASACSYGRPNSSETSEFQRTFSAFDQAGVNSRMFTVNNRVNGMPGYLHAKAIVIDGVRAWVGSVNGSDTATSANREFGVFFTELPLVQQLSADLENDFQNSGSETWQDSLNCGEGILGGPSSDSFSLLGPSSF
jgi:phosphatidylserine/phosphatidylglycerophosphate/cardiolipin synthase-like enzyme